MSDAEREDQSTPKPDTPDESTGSFTQAVTGALKRINQSMSTQALQKKLRERLGKQARRNLGERASLPDFEDLLVDPQVDQHEPRHSRGDVLDQMRASDKTPTSAGEPKGAPAPQVSETAEPGESAAEPEDTTKAFVNEVVNAQPLDGEGALSQLPKWRALPVPKESETEPQAPVDTDADHAEETQLRTTGIPQVVPTSGAHEDGEAESTGSTDGEPGADTADTAEKEGQPWLQTLKRGRGRVLSLPSGTRALSHSLHSVRTSFDEFNEGASVDPTRPTIILFASLTVVAALIATLTLFNTSLPSVFTKSDSPKPAAAAPQKETQEPQEKKEPQANKPQTSAPQVDSIEVVSFQNDGGDHPDQAAQMFDGNPDTGWQSRYFMNPDLPPENTIRLIVHLKADADVKEVSFDGPIEGGQVDLRVGDGSKPFETKVLTSAAMKGTTTLKPSEVTKGKVVTLDFVSLPVDDESHYRVKINELRVK